jgi:ABC-type Fe3+/spermidine/putrescine transport system ATPase subunit
MEIEKINQEAGESDLEKFREEIRNLMQSELDALQRGEKATIHFITHPKEKRTEFNAKELTEEDMEMYYKIKKGEVDLEEFKKYKAKIFSKRGNIFDSRRIFAAYLSNLFMVYYFNRGRNNKK